MMYPSICFAGGDAKESELGQLLLNATMYKIKEILDFSGLEDCAVVVKVLEQFRSPGMLAPHYDIAFRMASSLAAEEFYTVRDGTPSFDNCVLDKHTTELDGDFCRYESAGAEQAEMRQRGGRFLVSVSLIFRKGEAPHSSSVEEATRLVEELFRIYWDWLIRPGRSDHLCVIGVKD